MRIRWRRWLARSWHLSRWHYRRHGFVLAGRPSDHVWYSRIRLQHARRDVRRAAQDQASNPVLAESPVIGCASISRADRRVGRRPPTSALIRIRKYGASCTRSHVATCCGWISTEGVPGRGYRPTLLVAEDLDRNRSRRSHMLLRVRRSMAILRSAIFLCCEKGRDVMGYPNTGYNSSMG